MTLVLTDELWDVIGVACNNCDNHLWLNNRQNSILGKPRPSFPTREAYLAWNAATDREFFASLPPCNVCGVGRFASFVTNVPPRPLLCRVNGREITQARWENVTERYAGARVFWYEEDAQQDSSA